MWTKAIVAQAKNHAHIENSDHLAAPYNLAVERAHYGLTRAVTSALHEYEIYNLAFGPDRFGASQAQKTIQFSAQR
jgi:hypothetical protein